MMWMILLPPEVSANTSSGTCRSANSSGTGSSTASGVVVGGLVVVVGGVVVVGFVVVVVLGGGLVVGYPLALSTSDQLRANALLLFTCLGLGFSQGSGVVVVVVVVVVGGVVVVVVVVVVVGGGWVGSGLFQDRAKAGFLACRLGWSQGSGVVGGSVTLVVAWRSVTPDGSSSPVQASA